MAFLLNFANRASPESNQNQRRLLMLGQMMDMILTKRRTYNLPLPPDLELVREELERVDTSQRGAQVNPSPLGNGHGSLVATWRAPGALRSPILSIDHPSTKANLHLLGPWRDETNSLRRT
jgi:hypothetical protein